MQALPDLTRTIEKKVQADYAQIVQVDSTAFEDYQKNLAALRRINAMIKRYLDIDVTAKPPQDVKEIAEAGWCSQRGRTLRQKQEQVRTQQPIWSASSI